MHKISKTQSSRFSNVVIYKLLPHKLHCRQDFTLKADLSSQPSLRLATMASSLDAHCRGNDTFMTSAAFLLNHLTFGAPVLKDDLGVATCSDVGVVKAHGAASVICIGMICGDTTRLESS